MYRSIIALVLSFTIAMAAPATIKFASAAEEMDNAGAESMHAKPEHAMDEAMTTEKDKMDKKAHHKANKKAKAHKKHAKKKMHDAMPK